MTRKQTFSNGIQGRTRGPRRNVQSDGFLKRGLENVLPFRGELIWQYDSSRFYIPNDVTYPCRVVEEYGDQLLYFSTREGGVHNLAMALMIVSLTNEKLDHRSLALEER